MSLSKDICYTVEDAVDRFTHPTTRWFTKGAFICLQAMGKAVESTVIAMAREIVFGVRLPILMPVVWGLDGILYSFPVADILTFVIAAFVIRRTYQELSQEEAS